MEESTIWWVLAGCTVVAELLSGTFYLLMLALGMTAGALAAHFGMPLSAQIVAAAVVGAAAVLAWHYAKRRRPGDPSPRADRSVNLDVGELVMIDQWNTDGTAVIKYRGSTWTAMLRPGTPPAAGMHRVAELVGSRLLVDPA